MLDLVDSLESEIRKLQYQLFQMEHRKDLEIKQLQQKHEQEVARLKRIIATKNERILKLGGEVAYVGLKQHNGNRR